MTQSSKQLVAVYGTLREGRGNNRLLTTSTKLGSCTLQGWVMHPAGYHAGFPVIFASDAPQDEIVVEVYECTTEVLEGPLDGLEGHPTWYKRELVATPFGEAWIYVMQDESYKQFPRIMSGDFVQFQTGASA